MCFFIISLLLFIYLFFVFVCLFVCFSSFITTNWKLKVESFPVIPRWHSDLLTCVTVGASQIEFALPLILKFFICKFKQMIRDVIFCSIICLDAWNGHFHLLNILIYVDFQPEDEAGKIERFIHRKHGSYSLFECHRLRDQYLGCSHEDGSLVLIQVEDILHPDPRVLFVMHAKGSNWSSP